MLLGTFTGVGTFLGLGMFSTHSCNYLVFTCYWELYSSLLVPFQLLNFISNPGILEALLRHFARFVRVFNPSVIFTRSFMSMWNSHYGGSRSN